MVKNSNSNGMNTICFFDRIIEKKHPNPISYELLKETTEASKQALLESFKRLYTGYKTLQVSEEGLKYRKKFSELEKAELAKAALFLTTAQKKILKANLSVSEKAIFEKIQNDVVQLEILRNKIVLSQSLLKDPKTVNLRREMHCLITALESPGFPIEKDVLKKKLKAIKTNITNHLTDLYNKPKQNIKRLEMEWDVLRSAILSDSLQGPDVHQIAALEKKLENATNSDIQRLENKWQALQERIETDKPWEVQRDVVEMDEIAKCLPVLRDSKLEQLKIDFQKVTMGYSLFDKCADNRGIKNVVEEKASIWHGLSNSYTA